MKKTDFKISLVAFVLSLAFIVWYHYNQAMSHDVTAFDFLEDFFFYGFALLHFVMAVIFLARSKSLIKTWVILIYFALVIVSFAINQAVTKEDNSPLILQASTGDVVGGLALKFREDSTFRVENYGGIGYHWEEGHYTMRGNKFVLLYNNESAPEDVGKEILRKGDTLYYTVGQTKWPMRIVFETTNRKR